MPFILRSVTLAGVDSVYCPIKNRQEAWNRLTTDLDLECLEKMIKVLTLNDVVKTSENMLNNKTHGRIVIDVNA